MWNCWQIKIPTLKWHRGGGANMTLHVSRRAFLSGLGVMTAATALPAIPGYASWSPPLYPPMDLSYFDTPISPAPADILFGYASITWGGNDRQAIEDIRSLGFRGIQLRANVIQDFGRASDVRDLLENHQLEAIGVRGCGLRI